jgi:hypothetical protein
MAGVLLVAVLLGSSHLRPYDTPAIDPSPRHHGERFAGAFDPYSTAAQFPGWIESTALVRGPTLPVKYPKTFLLAQGWKRLGAISAWDVPG